MGDKGDIIYITATDENRKQVEPEFIDLANPMIEGIRQDLENIKIQSPIAIGCNDAYKFLYILHSIEPVWVDYLSGDIDDKKLFKMKPVNGQKEDMI